MGFPTEGFVLRPPRTAPGNARSTGDVGNGVNRDHKELPADYDYYEADELVEVAADMYRAAVLDNPNDSQEEFLIWAANSANLSTLESSDWTIVADDPSATATIPTGTNSVLNALTSEIVEDGTNQIVVLDTGGRGISDIRQIYIRRGDDVTGAFILTVGPDGSVDFDSQDPDGGLAVLPASLVGSSSGPADFTTLDGGLSTLRGDTILLVYYVLSSPRFWWSRNDRQVERFGWNGKTQKWEPFKGGPPKNQGVLTEDAVFELFPRFSRFDIDTDLPGTPGPSSDTYALIRVGIYPDRDATIPRVTVISDTTADSGEVDWSSLGDPDAAVGQTNGILIFNPAFIETNAGQTVWYVPEQFEADSNGEIGDLKEALTKPLFIVPIPGPTDRPFIRLGFRRYLTPVPVPTDNDLPDQSLVDEGKVYWSMTSGKLALSELDILKADPEDTSGQFDIQYLGNKVYYDGLSMTQTSVRTPDPVQLVDENGVDGTVPLSGKLYVPEAAPLPFPGVSGIRLTPDRSGQVPDASVDPATRENDSGLVRRVEGAGDTYLFTPTRAFDETEVVEYEKDLRDLPFLLRKTKSQIAREQDTTIPSPNSPTQFKRVGLVDDPIYFLQAEVMPAVYMDAARVYSREMGPFTFTGAETLYFALDGVLYTWNSSSLVPAPDITGTSYTAEEVALSINAVISGSGQVYAFRDRIVLEAGDSTTGTVEIGFGPSLAVTDRDFSAAAVLGILPGWRVDTSRDENWLPDNGTSLGVSRSPLNLSNTNDVPDFRATGNFSSTLFSESVPANPQFPLNNPPIQDIAGFGENQFFVVVDGLNIRRLDNLSDVLYDFGEGRFFWLDQGSISAQIRQPSSALNLGAAGVVPLTVHPAVATGNGFRLAEDGATFVTQVEGTDFLIPNEGSSGQVLPIAVVGGQVDIGAKGAFTAGGSTFTDTNAEFVTLGVKAGYRLHIVAGDAQGSYIVTADATSETSLSVTPPFLATAGGSEPYASWRIHEGFEDTVYDPAVVADVVYEQFNHLSQEPFKIRLLTKLGTGSDSLTAVVTEAYTRGRVVSLRFGIAYGSPTASLTPLERGVALGTIANGRLFIPDVSDSHFTLERFSIRVGTVSYPVGSGAGTVEVVAALTPDLVGDLIEVLDTTGELNFGDTTLSELGDSEVLYDQEFLLSTSLAEGEAEYNPATGAIQLSDTDSTLYASTDVYFVEQMITENALDVRVSPVLGSFFFNRPLLAGQIVETSYYAADSQGELTTGEEITEFLSLIVRLEEATRVDDTTYTVNPTGRTIATGIEAFVWVDNQLQNFGNAEDVVFDNGTLSFAKSLDASVVVLVNYAVYEAFGGEQAYNTSTIPVYRPPFFLEAEQEQFVVEGDRSAEFVPGKLFRVGAWPYYIKEATYNPTTDGTTVTVWPPSELEQGSRAPGNDALTLISSQRVTAAVDGVSTGSDLGFLLDLLDKDSNPIGYEPVDSGMIDILFYGDVTRFAVPGHLLEIDGYPTIIAGAELAEDGRTTKVSLTSPVARGFNSSVDPVKLSVRPIYPPAPREFVGINPFVQSEDYEVILFGETDSDGNELPGRLLVEGVHYNVNVDDGSMKLLEPLQAPLAPGQRILFSYTRLKVLTPFIEDGGVVYPRYAAGYSFITAPSESNGYLGTKLIAKYTYRSPDSFYYRTTPLVEYMGEVAEIAVSRVAAQSPAGGAIVVSGASTENYTQGRFGFAAERRDLLDQDRAARAFLSLYNEVIVAFEQVNEAINGDVVGDRDGKFRFFVGRNRTYAPPGFEDEITGDINSRLIWSQVFRAANGSFGVYPDDPVVDPETATIPDPTTGEVEGDPMDPFVLGFYIQEQRRYVKNDMDDVVLVGTKRPSFISFKPKTVGDFLSMWEPHLLSRLFPEATLAFTTTFPGLEANFDTFPFDEGVYSFFKFLAPPKLLRKDKDDDTPVVGSTFWKSIGVISNPALGEITNISDADARERLPRARVWAYSPEGYPDIEPASDGYATIIATPGLIRDFPIDPTTGFPDFTQLVSNGGTIEDCGSGAAELSYPPFLPTDTSTKPPIRQQITVGRPTGESFGVGNAGQTLSSFLSLDVDPIYGGVYIQDVKQGCILILGDDQGNPLAGSDVLALEGDLGGNPLTLEQGDTVYVTLNTAIDATDMSDPPTAEELEQFADAIPTLDCGLRRRRGVWVDRSLPSGQDPNFPLKEILNQKAPKPLMAIESDVEFTNTNRTPTQIPALQGLPTNDSGDYTLPFLAFTNTELDRLGEVATAFIGLTQTDSPSPQAVYPDEIVVDDGFILAANDGTRNPATFYTTDGDFLPITNGTKPDGATPGVYTPFSGYGDAASYDLLLVQLNTGNPGLGNVTGVLSIAEVSTSAIEVPRFITSSTEGSLVKYSALNVMAHVRSGGTSGMTVTFAAGVTTFTIDSGTPILNDGSGAAAVSGGLNNILSANNAIVIRLYENIDQASPGTLVEEIVLTSSLAHGDAGADEAVVAISVKEKTIEVTTAAAFVTNTGVEYDFTIDIDTYINDTTNDLISVTLGGTSPGVGNGDGSTTAYIDTDRLTFVERFDMTSALQRGSTLSDGTTVIAAGIEVWEVTGMGGAILSVNSPPVVNPDSFPATGGEPLTLLERIGPSPDGTVGAGVPYVATYLVDATGSGNERGRFKVMSWERVPYGSGGVLEIGDQTEISAAAVPSSEENETGFILSGTGYHQEDLEGVTSVVTSTGDVASVVSGDILVVKTAEDGAAAVCAGTYLVRHAIKDNSGAGYREVALTGSAGPGGQFFDGVFPTITDIGAWSGAASRTITVSTLGVGPSTSTNGTLWDDDATAGNPFGASGMTRLYVIPNLADPTSVVSVDISSIDTGANEFTLVGGTAQDNEGNAITNNQFLAAISVGQKVSGMRFLPIGTSGAPLGNGLPSNSTVGHRDTPNPYPATTYGFLHMVISNTNLVGDVSTGGGLNATFTLVELVDGGAADGSEDLGIIEAEKVDSKQFQSDEQAVVYDNVAGWFDLNGLPATGAGRTWKTIHVDTTAASPVNLDGVRCLLPSDKFVAGDTVDEKGNFDTAGNIGFRAEAGVFCEPSWPRPSIPLDNDDPHVVDASITASFNFQIGWRNPDTFGDTHIAEDGTETDGVIAIWKTSGAGAGEGTILYPMLLSPGSVTIEWTSGGVTRTQTDDGLGNFVGDGTPAGSSIDYPTSEIVLDTTGLPPDTGTIITISGTFFAEPVTFEVRRIRRFHDAIEAVTANLEPLRYAYEIRRGVADSYTASTRTFVASTPTQLGDFESKDVNINPGDVVRILDSDGVVLDTAEIASITDGDTLTMRKPGFTQVAAADIGTTYTDFEVYLNQAPVPHEQSNEQLLGLITDEVLFESVANYTTQDGGFVDTTNELKDTTVSDWTALGIQVGDIVVVDPAGPIEGPTGPATTPERGSRPFGDRSVPNRVTIHEANPVANLDDNRGFYRVSADPETTHLPLSGASGFSGEAGSAVTFGSGDTEYAVLPVVNNDVEGQQDLRVTSLAGVGTSDPNSFSGTNDSVGPFSYRIIRPSSLFSEEAIDLVLFMRERMLSWIEEMETPMSGGKSGNYYVFQRDEHLNDVGNPGVPDEGLGIIHNSFVEGLAGVTGVSPFANTTDCLSVLDRRFWVLDFRLDSETPPNSTTYFDPYATFAAGTGRPVLPDLISGVLDVEDRFRQLRFSWIKFRTDRVSGTITAVVRFDAALPERLEEQQDLLRLQEGLSET